MCGPAKELRPGLTKCLRRAQSRPRKQGASLLVQGVNGQRLRAGVPEPVSVFVPFFYLHSRGKDFNSVFARHSDGDRAAPVPGQASAAATESFSTGVSWLCHVTPFALLRGSRSVSSSLPLSLGTGVQGRPGQEEGDARMLRRAHPGTAPRFRFAA